MVDHLGSPGLQLEIERLWRAIRQVSKATLQNGSIGRAGIRVYDGGIITVENGGLDVTGYARIIGELLGTGELDWDGPASFAGNTSIGGTLDVTGATTLQALVTLLNNLTIQGGGKITITGGPSPATLQSGALAFGTGGKVEGYSGGLRMASGGAPDLVVSTGGISLTAVSGSRYLTVSSGGTSVGGPFTASSKSFVIPHPLKRGHLLQHGCTEGPAHGVEYHGRVLFDDDGEAVVVLPDYFEALTLTEGRTVQLTPTGPPFPVGADEVVDGRVTVYGEAGRSAYWLVKASRADLEVELAPPERDLEGSV